MLKRKTSEMGYATPIPQLGGFIAAELDRHGETFKSRGRSDLLSKQDLPEDLNAIFRKAVL